MQAALTPSLDELRVRLASTIRIRARAICALFAAAFVLQPLGLQMPVAWVALVVGLMLSNCALHARLLRTLPTLRVLPFTFHASNILAITAINYLLGGVLFPAGALLYVLVVVNVGTPCYLFANLGGGAYAALVLLQYYGLLPPSPVSYEVAVNGASLPVSLPGEMQWPFVAFVWLVLNAAAAYTHRSNGLLEESRRRLVATNALLDEANAGLERRVRERTQALEAATALLEEKTVALKERSSRVRAFVYTVTHDLKNPVNTAAIGTNSLLEREGDRLSPKGRKDLERIFRVASQAERMILDLREVFRITSRREAPESVDLTRLMAEVVEGLLAQIEGKGVRLHVGDLVPVWGQPGQLRHAFTNLLDNAIKYVEMNRGEVEVSATNSDGTVLVAVRDNGIGIPEIYHSAVFRLFQTVPTPRDGHCDGASGTGVGLAIVKHIVEANGGQVWVTSTPGAGSTFYVRLPGAAAREQAA